MYILIIFYFKLFKNLRRQR